MNERAAKIARRAGRYQKVLAPDSPLPEVAKRQWDALSHKEKAPYSRAWRAVVGEALKKRGLAKIPPLVSDTERRQLPRSVRKRLRKSLNRAFSDQLHRAVRL